MPKKATDPFMCDLWSALVADDLGPGGNQTGWNETPVRIRNRFIRAVRPVLQSGAAFQASAMGFGSGERAEAPPKAAPASRKGRRPDPRELQLPLMTSVQPAEKSGKKPAR